MKYFVYLLKSKKDNQFYIGQTNNLKVRLAKHNSGEVLSTKNRIPFELVGYVDLQSRKEALKLEKLLKNHSHHKLKFIRKFISGFDWT